MQELPTLYKKLSGMRKAVSELDAREDEELAHRFRITKNEARKALQELSGIFKR
jgi:transcription initiation factor IIE alpha subunit